jgi:DNA transformation protein
MADSPLVETLPNIGTKIALRLNEIGIRTKADLELVGPVAAYQRILKNHPQQTLSVCYYLYSFDAALKGCHWDDLSDDRKAKLREQAKANSQAS